MDNNNNSMLADNRKAAEWLEPGWVIVREEDISPQLALLRGRLLNQSRTDGVTGDVWTRIDDYSFAGHRDWLPGGTGGIPPVTYIFDIGLIEAGGKVDLEPATQTIIGGILEVPIDGKSYTRKDATWVESGGGAYIFDIGLLEDPIGTVNLEPATPTVIGGITEPPIDDKGYVRRTDLTGVSAWVPPALPTDMYTWGIGLEESTLVPGEINLLPAKYDPADLGGVYILPATGIGVAQDGALGGIPATDTTIGMFFDAPYDGKSYTRTNGQWSSTATMAPADLPIAGYTIAELGAVYIVPNRALRVELDGALDVVPAAPDQLGVILDPPFDSGNPDVTYTRKWGAWEPLPDSMHVRIAGLEPDLVGVVYVEPALGISLNAEGGLGIHPTTPDQIGGIIDAPYDSKDYVRNNGGWEVSTATSRIAGLRPEEVGVVYIVPGLGISLGDDGGIGVHPSTPDQHGTIVDAPYDSKDYVRNNGDWLESVSTKPAGNTLVEIGVVYVPDDRGLTLGTDGALMASIATDVKVGSIFDAPGDGKEYVRKLSQWVPSLAATGAVIVQDTPPIGAMPNQLWWDSNSGDLFILYQDMDSIQWVQINSSGGGSTTGDYLPLTGGTVTGNVTVSANRGRFTINAVGTDYNALVFGRDDVTRWELQQMGPGAGFEENLALYSYNDAGGFIGEIFTIGRNNRVMDFVFAPTVAGAPIVMMTELDVTNDRISRLEERLARIEGRS